MLTHNFANAYYYYYFYSMRKSNSDFCCEKE